MTINEEEFNAWEKCEKWWNERADFMNKYHNYDPDDYMLKWCDLSGYEWAETAFHLGQESKTKQPCEMIDELLLEIAKEQKKQEKTRKQERN